jgi:hypothetical protein
MKRQLRQAVILLLGVLFTQGINLSAVQTANMAAEMTMSSNMAAKMTMTSNMAAKTIMASDMRASGHDDCGGCAGGSDDYAKVMACASVCSAPVLALLPQTVAMTVVKATADVFVSDDTLLLGRASPPDPYPPRSSNLG